MNQRKKQSLILIERIKTRWCALLKRFSEKVAESRLSEFFDVAAYGSRYAYYTTYVIAAFTVFFIIWAALTSVDEISRGDAKVVPSQSVQKIQHLEGGILGDMLVKEGDTVVINQSLLRIDNVGAASSYSEAKAQSYTLLAARARLEAERDNQDSIAFDDTLQSVAADVVRDQRQIFENRRSQFNQQQNVSRQQIAQREKDGEEIKSRLTQAQRNLALAKREYAVSKPLEKIGAISKIELINIEAKVNELRGQAESLAINLPKAKDALAEAESRLAELLNTQRNEALRELAQTNKELDSVNAVLTTDADRVTRTVVRSPVAGKIKTIHKKTIGSVIKPAEDILDIVPLDERLLVEGRIEPKDVAFIHAGLPAIIKISAYDSGRYGILKGTVEQISADTITDEKGFTYYKVTVATHRGGEDAINNLPILPGMTATLEILTGKKSILKYLLTPISHITDNALTER